MLIIIIIWGCPRISYCSADATFDHVFAFIATNRYSILLDHMMSFLSFSIAFFKLISIISFWTLPKTSTSALPRFPSLHLTMLQKRDVGMPRLPLPKKENGPGCYADHRPGALLWAFLPMQFITILKVIILSDVMLDCIILIAKQCLTDDQDGDKLKAFNLAFECWQAEKEKIRKERGRGLSHHHKHNHLHGK